MVQRIDPYAGYNFAVEMNGMTRAGFRECSGLEVTQNAVEYREGTDRNNAVRKLPGMATHGDITLSRGITDDKNLWSWREDVLKGKVERHAISIMLMDDIGAPKITWHLFECWPRQWTGPSFNATSDEVAIEQLILAYERIELDKWGA
jgi:phage tail-like protein